MLDLCDRVPMLTRILTGVAGASLGLLTARQLGLPIAANQARVTQLAQAGRDAGLTPITTYWRDGEPGHQLHLHPPDGAAHEVEPVIALPGVALATMQALAAQFQLEAYLYGGAETEGRLVLIYPRSGVLLLRAPRDEVAA
jgi:hypothetical protein